MHLISASLKLTGAHTSSSVASSRAFLLAPLLTLEVPGL
jgi:hypothetical protein